MLLKQTKMVAVWTMLMLMIMIIAVSSEEQECIQMSYTAPKSRMDEVPEDHDAFKFENVRFEQVTDASTTKYCYSATVGETVFYLTNSDTPGGPAWMVITDGCVLLNLDFIIYAFTVHEGASILDSPDDLTWYIDFDGGQATFFVTLVECSSGSSGAVEGDPHIRTFDGLRYDFNGLCEYLITGYQGSDEQLQTFQVSARTRVAGKNVYLRNLRTKFGGEEIYFYQNKYMRVNGNAVEAGQDRQYPDYRITRNSTWISLFTNFGLTLHFSGNAKMSVDITSNYNGRLVGLLGDKNGQPGNDLRHRDGRILSVDDACLFADSWRMTWCAPTPCTSQRGENNPNTLQQKVHKSKGKIAQIAGN